MCQNMLQCSLNADEVSLLDDIEFVGHGEIYNVTASIAETQTTTMLEDPLYKLIQSLRDVGRLNKVVIHDGVPKFGEYFTKTPGGRTAKIKIKF